MLELVGKPLVQRLPEMFVTILLFELIQSQVFQSPTLFRLKDRRQKGPSAEAAYLSEMPFGLPPTGAIGGIPRDPVHLQ